MTRHTLCLYIHTVQSSEARSSTPNMDVQLSPRDPITHTLTASPLYCQPDSLHFKPSLFSRNEKAVIKKIVNVFVLV